jgi:glycosyltransferase involved in cell wall biosynthesis
MIDPATAEQIRAGFRPRPDYLELARAMDADTLDITEARRRGGRWARLVEAVGGTSLLLAWTCFRLRRSYQAIFTDGEQVGLPLALLGRLTGRSLPPHVMVVHLLSVRKKVVPYRVFRLGRFIDTMIVYSQAQRRFISETLSFPADRVIFTPFMVDTEYFRPTRPSRAEPPVVCTAGLEFRDYPTLMRAAVDLDAKVVIAAASNWSKRADSTIGVAIPDNVEICSLNFVELRRLYASADLVVMPLYDVDFQAGVTTILEAMAMGKAVVCSASRGQTDIITEGVTGIYVRPADPVALRDAIASLLESPERAAELGQAGRRFVVEHCEVSTYAERLTGIVRDAIAKRGSARRCRATPVP